MLPPNRHKSFPTKGWKVCAGIQSFCFNAHRFIPLGLHIHDGAILLEGWNNNVAQSPTDMSELRVQPLFLMVPTAQRKVYLYQAGIRVAIIDRKWAVESAAWTALDTLLLSSWAKVSVDNHHEVFPLHLTMCQYKQMMAPMWLTWTSLLPWLRAMTRGGKIA